MNKNIDLNNIINSLIGEKTKIVKLGFTPISNYEYDKELINDDNNALYIKSKKENIFDNEKIMFPMLSHA